MHLFFKFSFRPKLPVLPTASSPQSKEDKHWLEEQSNKSGLIGIESEGIDVVHILVDVARENGYIEKCQQRTCDCSPFAAEEDDAKAESNFNYARCQHNKVGKIWAELQPGRHLSYKLLTIKRQMTESCIGHKQT